MGGGSGGGVAQEAAPGIEPPPCIGGGPALAATAWSVNALGALPSRGKPTGAAGARGASNFTTSCARSSP
eukprot:4473534-Amphidinium_carterae.1